MTMPTRTELCACGLLIIVKDPTEERIAAAVLRHNRSWAHQAWRGERYHRCAGVGSPCVVTIPLDRDLCHYCTRTAALVARVAA